MPGKENRQCKGPEAGAWLENSKNNRRPCDCGGKSQVGKVGGEVREESGSGTDGQGPVGHG